MDARKNLIDAMGACLETTPIDQITVNDIIEAADVSRRSFYRLFGNKYELLKEYYQGQIEALLREAESLAESYKTTYQILAFFKAHEDITRNMFFSKDSFAFKQYFRNLCVEDNMRFWEQRGVNLDDGRIRGALELYSYGTVSYIMDWIKAGMPGDLHELAEMFMLAYPVGVFQGPSVPLPTTPRT